MKVPFDAQVIINEVVSKPSATTGRIKKQLRYGSQAQAGPGSSMTVTSNGGGNNFVSSPKFEKKRSLNNDIET